MICTFGWALHALRVRSSISRAYSRLSVRAAFVRDYLKATESRDALRLRMSLHIWIVVRTQLGKKLIFLNTDWWIMKCPRCKTVNENTRTICTKCGYYLFRNSTTPRSFMSKEEIAKADRELMWKKVKTVLKWFWRILVVIAVTYWIIAVIVFIAGNLGISLF